MFQILCCPHAQVTLESCDCAVVVALPWNELWDACVQIALSALGARAIVQELRCLACTWLALVGSWHYLWSPRYLRNDLILLGVTQSLPSPIIFYIIQEINEQQHSLLPFWLKEHRTSHLFRIFTVGSHMAFMYGFWEMSLLLQSEPNPGERGQVLCVKPYQQLYKSQWLTLEIYMPRYPSICTSSSNSQEKYLILPTHSWAGELGLGL